jgi:hypothetical protein
MLVFEIFYAPGKVFESLAGRRAAWVLPLLVDMLVLVAITAATVHWMGLETILRQRLENSRLSPEQMQAAMSRANSPAQAYISYAAAALGGPVMLLALAGLLTMFAMISNVQPKFGTMFSMVALGFLPYWVVIGVMTTLVLMAVPDRSMLDIGNMLATNVGAFLDKATTSRALYSFMSSMDLISFTEIGLLAYGFAKITRSSLSAGLGAVVSVWLLYVVVKTGISMVF